MDVILGTLVLTVAALGLISLYVLGTLHVIRCTESRQERFSLKSVGRSIRLLKECVLRFLRKR